jgi:UDP-N-acetylglucosamine:LPS N-acetylglucosamine transferase
MQPEDIRDKKVLLSPLNWGMGHVSRCIGLVHQLINQGNQIVIACNDDQKAVFESYFPEASYVFHEGYPFHFGGKGRFAWDLFKKLGALKKRLKDENLEVEDFVNQHNIDVVLSDHRYGFFSKHVPSVFITHQYHLPVSRLQAVSDKWHKKRMRPFCHVWILDYDDSRLSGKLTQQIDDDRVAFVGPYSRFSKYEMIETKQEENVIVISGPQKYAQQFADEMGLTYPNALFICPETIYLDSSLRRKSGTWLEQDALILQAKQLISRSGYSTIMDLEILQIPAMLYPTPGQAEQLYLHERLTDCSEYTP